MTKLTWIKIGVIITGICVVITSVFGIASLWLKNPYDYINVFGNTITIYGGGVYRYHTVSQVYQVVAHDLVNMIIALPVYLISFYRLTQKKPYAAYAFTGAALYFAFTFGIYTFFANFNALFVVYVTILGINFYLVVVMISMLSWDRIQTAYKERYPYELVGWTMIVVSSLMALFWLSQALPEFLTGIHVSELLPVGSTLVPHAIDLAFLLPPVLIAGLHLIKRKPFGFLVGSILPVFLIMMMSSVVAKGFLLTITGTERAIEMMVFMGLFLIVSSMILIINLRHFNVNHWPWKDSQ